MNSFPSSRVRGEQNHTDNTFSPITFTTIQHLLRLVALDTNLALEFCQVWTVREFKLGQSFATDDAASNNTSVVSLVCRGQVRLLRFDATLGREVSVQRLGVGETFGADGLFCVSPFRYRAIASDAGTVASITVSDLKEWLQRLPNLELSLRQAVETRQKLIFLKTTTQLRLQTSQTLQQQLPYFVQIQIKAGTSLQEATPASKGRFWLMHGNISNANADVSVTQVGLQVGDSWGYPDMALLTGIAETDLVVYHLPKDNCELVNIKRTTPTTQIPPQIGLHRESKLQHFLPPIPSARRYPFIGQQSSSDCGAACLAMICMYWGKRISVNTLRNLAQIDRMGASLPALVDAAEKLGYHASGVRASLSALEWQTNPWIAHWQSIHYVVVWEVRSSKVIISDPAIGKQTLLRSEFETNWTGYALTLTPTERLQILKSEKISLEGVWQNFWHYRYLLAQILLASLVLQVFGLVTPLIAGVAIDKVMPFKSFVTLNILALGFLVFGIWRILVRAVRQYLLDYLSNHIDMTLVSSFIHHMLHLPLEFFASRQVGDIVSRVEENRKIQVFLTRRVVSVTLDALCTLLSWGLIAYYNLQLTLIALGLTISAALLTLSTSPSLKRVSRETHCQTASQNAAIVEMITQMTTVKTAAAEQWVLERWEERFANAMKVRFRFQRLSNNLQFVNSLINHLGSTFVLWYGAILVMHEHLTLGKFVAFNMLIGSVINPILGLVELQNDFQEMLVSMERLNDVLETQAEASSQVSLQVLPSLRGEVHFENVAFRYHPDEANVLQNISFFVQQGKTIGIVGANGSGKTTLVNLLAGSYRPQSGRILIDGYDIAGVLPQSLRAQLGIVTNETFLFTGTILENITLFNPHFTIEDAIAASKIASIHSSIASLPLGYNTQVGTQGRMLSAGQKQRIALARALIRNPRILILDEATSLLDTETETNLQQNLIRSVPGCTTFIITHRLPTLQRADQILVLNQGIIVEQGKHQELLAINGLYSYLIQQYYYM